MKRSPLKRKTPLPRGTKQLNRTPLKPISDRKRAMDRRMKPMLDEYRKEFPVCQRYGCGRAAREIHEIAAGPYREAARASRACVLHLCPVCHAALQGTAYERQLAHKMIADPEGFDIREFNRVVRRQAVCFADVTAFLGVR